MTLPIPMTLPIQDPVLIFTFVLLIILFAPLVMRRLKMPGILGLILAGAIVGPHGLNLLRRDSSIVLFGTVGLLYIMFIAGLDIDLDDFKGSFDKSLLFGLLTFAIPQITGALAAYYILDLTWPPSILLGSMFASHTLVAYPVIRSLGITKNRAVAITVGGTAISNILALFILAVIVQSTRGAINALIILRLGLSLLVLVLLILFGLPLVGKWYFRHAESEGISQYIFVLAMVFISGFLVRVASVEPIIGAFLAGLGLNRLIPEKSTLMNRIEFVGNALFIPFFLISVGMLVDLRVLLEGGGGRGWLVILVMVVIANAAKWLAAFIIRRMARLSSDEGRTVFGLSTAQAAGALAAVTIGYDLGLFGDHVLNGTIMMILATCLVSSFVVERAGRAVAIAEGNKGARLPEPAERILVPISNPETIAHLMDLAILLKQPGSAEPIYALTVVEDDEEAAEKLAFGKQMMEGVLTHACASENPVRIISRIDINIAGGIIRTIREFTITNLIIGWNAEISMRQRIFGSILDRLLRQTQQMIMVSKIISPLSAFDTMAVLVPRNAEYESGFSKWLGAVRRLSGQLGLPVSFYGHHASLDFLKDELTRDTVSMKATYHPFEDWSDITKLIGEITRNDLLITVSSRQGGVSWSNHLDQVPRMLARHFQPYSFIIIFPYMETKDQKFIQMRP